LTREDDDDDDDVAAHVIARDITSMVTARTSRVAMRRARHRDRPILGASPISRDFAGRDSRARRLENIAGVSPVEKKRRDGGPAVGGAVGRRPSRRRRRRPMARARRG
jgi:hypothetical protein